MKRMERLFVLLLAAILTVNVLSAAAASADTEETADAVSMVRALGIMTGDNSGSLNLEKHVTRAEFCKMLVSASSYKDTVGGSSGYSLFKDVKSNHWAVEYIKVCVENGWLYGYTDGTFRPDQTIKLEEAATVALRLLGYTSEDLAGSYPTAQLSKFEAIGLHDGFSAQQGQHLTRSDCAYLFYNLMAAETKDNQTYAATLGYSLDSTGHVDYASLVTDGTKGPYTLTSGALSGQLPFSGENITVYRNGKAAALSDAETYDIYYYNANTRTVWIYSERVTGTYTAASPSQASPTAVTVAGGSYDIETSSAAYKLSTQGQFSIGDTVTLLLGMNGQVADVYSSDQASGTYYGIVLTCETSTQTGSASQVSVTNILRVACTDGIERSFEIGSKTFAENSIVSVDYAKSTPVSHVSQKALSGSVNASGTKFGSYAFADNVEILDTDTYGNFKRIYPSRLAGYALASSSVLYYQLNSQNEITHLILRDVTGDLYTYGILTQVRESTSGTQTSGAYEAILDGATTTLSGNTVFHVETGPAVFRMDGNSAASIRNLTKATLTSLTSTTAKAGNQSYSISEDVQVYIYRDGEYYQANIGSVSDTGEYTLTGYYDSFGHDAGGRIRLVVAKEN